jgi:DNA-binding CsgD family transcriptional regulator
MENAPDPSRRPPQGTPPSAEHLTPRQREVLEAYGRLHSAEAVAEEFSVSVRTVRNHLHQACKRLGCKRSREALYLESRGRHGFIDRRTERGAFAKNE